MTLTKKKINDIRDTFQNFTKYISELEKKRKSKFKLISFQVHNDRFGHSWTEPSFICTLYDVEPTEVLLIQVSKPFSEFCNAIHAELGFMILNIENVSCGGEVYELGTFSLSKELKVDNYLLIFGHNKYQEVYFNSMIGSRKGLKPFIKSSIFRRFKKNVFNKYNISSDKKIVVLHIRDSGWFGSGYHNYRDASLEPYILTVKYLLSRNYIIVRVGDKSMAKFPYSDKNFIDLPHLSSFQDGDDVIITAFCNLYVGQTSGPMMLPILFNKDIVITNETNPFIGLPFKEDNKKSKVIVLYKTRLDIKSGKKLPMGNFLAGPFIFKKSQYENLGIKLVENTSEEIKNCVEEMLYIKDSRFNAKKYYETSKELNFIWTLRQISGFGEFNIGRPSKNDFVSRQHLNYDDQTSFSFGQPELVLGRGIPKNKVILFKWILLDAAKRIFTILKLLIEFTKDYGFKETFVKIKKKLSIKYL